MEGVVYTEVGEILKFDIKYACLISFSTQFACCYLFNLVTTNSFDSGISLLVSPFSIFTILFSFPMPPEMSELPFCLEEQTRTLDQNEPAPQNTHVAAHIRQRATLLLSKTRNCWTQIVVHRLEQTRKILEQNYYTQTELNCTHIGRKKNAEL